MARRTLAVAAALALLALSPGTAAACVAGAKCLRVAPSVDPADLPQPGDVLPRDDSRLILNTAYHGLPASDGTFWYYQMNRRVYRVDPATMVILEDVTRAARNLRR